MCHSCQHLATYPGRGYARHSAGDTKHPSKTETEAGCEVKGKLDSLSSWRWENIQHVFMLNGKIPQKMRYYWSRRKRE